MLAFKMPRQVIRSNKRLITVGTGCSFDVFLGEMTLLHRSLFVLRYEMTFQIPLPFVPHVAVGAFPWLGQATSGFSRVTECQEAVLCTWKQGRQT